MHMSNNEAPFIWRANSLMNVDCQFNVVDSKFSKCENIVTFAVIFQFNLRFMNSQNNKIRKNNVAAGVWQNAA